MFEKGRIAGEQSGRNWGWVRQQGRSPVELPLMIESLRLWKELPSELGEDIGFRQGGTLYLAENDAQLAGLEEWLAVAREHGLDTRICSLRANSGRPATDGDAGPARCTRRATGAPNPRAPGARSPAARSGTARRSSARPRCAASRPPAGAFAVVTEHGRVATRAVVCAAGAWTRLFCGSLGIGVPQLPVLGTVARTAPAPRLLGARPGRPAVAIRRRADGGYTVAHGGSSLHS